MTSPELAGGELEVDLGALADNYRILAKKAASARTAAVVKANAYGLGVEAVAPALHTAGCRTFCVAHIEEGLELRRLLPRAEIFILHGLLPETAATVAGNELIPVLNDLSQIAQWQRHARHTGALPTAIQFDTGMSRVGLPADEAAALIREPERLEGLELRCWISHLVAAEEPNNPLNSAQLQRFKNLLAQLPAAPASLANSSGIFLGPDYHFDMVRPGVALYGVNPTPGQANPMHEVVRLRGRIVQLQQIDAGQGVGYGAAWQAERPSRIATVAVGYADGYLRGLAQGATCGVAGTRVPIVGRVSMDLITIDITDVADSAIAIGDAVSLIGDGVDIDELAAAGGTIAYEILTSLGPRYHRRYVGARGQR